MRLTTILLLAASLQGCIYFHRPAPVAPPEVAATIQFPAWSREATTALEGPQLKALQIAINDFLPPRLFPPWGADELTQCLLRLDTYEVWMRRGEKMTFIHFTPKEDERCGLEPLALDAGASYAIGDDGVILKRE